MVVARSPLHRMGLLLVVLALVASPWMRPSLAIVNLDRGYDNTLLYKGAKLDVPVPRLTRMTPSDGPARGNALITVWGSNFRYTNFLSCRFSERESWDGQVWNMDAIWVSEAMILCYTPDFILADGSGTTSLCKTNSSTSFNPNSQSSFDPNAIVGGGHTPGDGANDNPNPAVNFKFCDRIILTVTNDGITFSGYYASQSGSYLIYRIYIGIPDGSLQLLDMNYNPVTTPGLKNSTILANSETTLTLAVTTQQDYITIRDSTTNICMFTAVGTQTVVSSAWMTPATWVKDMNTTTPNVTVSVYTCQSRQCGEGCTDTQWDVHLGYAAPNAAGTAYQYLFTASAVTLAIYDDLIQNPHALQSLRLATRSDLLDTSVTPNNPIMTLQRAPMWGNTELTIRGTHLHPSNNAKCAFFYKENSYRTTKAQCDTVNGWQTCVRSGVTRCCILMDASWSEDDGASWDPISSVYGFYRCMSPRHEMVTGTEGTVYQPSIRVEVFLNLDFVATFVDGLDISITNGWWGDDLTLTNVTIPDMNSNMVLRISDLYVSPSGSDYDLDANLINGGDGTPYKPYRTIQRALDRAVINSRTPSDYAYGPYGLMHGQPAAKGSNQQFNRDLVILRAGYYRGPGNVALRPRGKLVTIRSEWYDLGAAQAGQNGNLVVVDCENSGFGFIDERGQRFWDVDVNVERETLVVQGITVKDCVNRRTYSVYDYVNQRNTLHRNPMIAYQTDTATDPNRHKAPVFPFANRFRPGWRPIAGLS